MKIILQNKIQKIALKSYKKIFSDKNLFSSVKSKKNKLPISLVCLFYFKQFSYNSEKNKLLFRNNFSH